MNKLKHTRRGFIKCLTALGTIAWSACAQSAIKLTDAAGDALSRINGMVIRRGEANYPLWRSSMSWYIFKPERHPDIIMRASSEADVIEAINYARNTGNKIVVRSTGHNPARAVLRDGGVLLDLSQMRKVEIDADNRTAWIQPGIKAEELLHLTTGQGLAFPAAHTGIVGLGGYLPGGGIGWNMPEYGIACRSILAAEVITADGKKHIASADKNQELHWAIRGSGPGMFGAIIRYKLQLYPLHQAIRLNRYVIPLDKMKDAMEKFGRIGKVADRRLETFIKVGRFYPADKPFAKRDLVCTVGFFAFGDSENDAKALMSPVEENDIASISVVKKENIPITYEDLYRPPETDYSSPNRIVVENIWTDRPEDSLMALTKKMKSDPPASPRSFLLMGWSMNRTLEDPSSCVLTAARHYLSWYMIAENENDSGSCYRWMDESVELVEPFTRGHYINEIDTLRYPQQVSECFSKESWAKLGKLRKKYDPDAVFHTFLGHN